jgi:ribose/xylose/arabinose/galactoside ABC-type transport system permease subunit
MATKENGTIGRWINDSRVLLNKHTNLATFLFLAILLTFLTKGASFSSDSLKNLVVAESVRAFATMGVGLIIITRGIDLSIGSVVGLVASVAASFAQTSDYAAALYPAQNFPLWLPIVAGVVTGALFGLFNGVLVAYAKLPPFIATLGTMSIAHGLELIYTRANVVGSLKPQFKQIAQGYVGPIPNLAIFVCIAAFILFLLLRFFRQGINFYAIGGNPAAARVSGINVSKELVMVYFYGGILYGVAGVLLASRIGLANALSGNGMELDAIAAATIGGVSQTGGIGKTSGMLLGVLTLGIINYGMTYLGVDSYYQLLLKGFIIIIAVFFDMKKYAHQ